jgi:hypothetical protein
MSAEQAESEESKTDIRTNRRRASQQWSNSSLGRASLSAARKDIPEATQHDLQAAHWELKTRLAAVEGRTLHKGGRNAGTSTPPKFDGSASQTEPHTRTSSELSKETVWRPPRLTLESDEVFPAGCKRAETARLEALWRRRTTSWNPAWRLSATKDCVHSQDTDSS